MLRVENLTVYYDEAIALQDVSLTIESGTIVTIVGANGSGKTTLVNAIAGILRPRQGRILMHDLDLSTILTHQICANGIAVVPEGRRLFHKLSVLDNLKMGAYSPHAQPKANETLAWVFETFPILAQRQKQLAGTLSGGEQQMLAIGRSLLAQPQLLLLDEPSLGLAPLIVTEIFTIIRKINTESGVTILLVEQNVKKALEAADKGYILSNGRIVQEGLPTDLAADNSIQKAYLGI
ncbi:ABC transporter ATP-binding protein [Chloroflexi bacterium TSY]|nr:ABC transporter ATP-binding protein [Chloroflexi bacterium TSY]